MSRNKYYNKLDPTTDYARAVQVYRNKYYNLFRANFKWTGLTYREEDYVMRRLWETGTVAAFKIRLAETVGFAPWAMINHDMYGLPETVNLIDTYGSGLVPQETMIVDKDCVLGYAQRNKKSVRDIVEWYIGRMAAVDCVENTNLELQKLPYLIPTDEDESKLRDIITKIQNNEPVIFANVDPTMFKAVQTEAPYILDKLTEYKASLENELKTYLGIDNSGSVQKQEQVNIDELNAVNDEINDSSTSFLDCMKEFCDNIKETLGITITVEPTSKPVQPVGEYHDIDEDNKPGPEEQTDD